MFLSDFDYSLPESLIARYPTTERSGSRLLRIEDVISDRQFKDFASFLKPEDLLVFNNTRVIRARLRGTKETGGKVEILVERISTERDALAHIKASKSPKPHSIIHFDANCSAEVMGRQEGLFQLRFSVPLAEYLEENGEIPLPPYIDRDEESADGERYQTVYADPPGAVAAPTAGLHFDEPMLAAIEAVGIRSAFITLHVGAGTFQTLREESVSANRLHAERIHVSDEVCAAVKDTRAKGGRVVAVGTTSVRALEAASGQGEITPYSGETDIFIRPGYQFNSVDLLLTNFHLPKSSLMLLVTAFGGYERIMSAYHHAVRERYRFFSYGDAMLIAPIDK
ncbi:MAG: tRNA preQ1(34) S-adenosylmethionine ribosyltransferase-isomerase QueA [Woeseia sp.]|jgi:S-adenosylmethionine:tRNA ribosyltransferase-isomerase|nr:tRNA preQ1(34) S-adenosylmethionine ribosyltransferase-isomerase QueA [Woeseia sp.]MBT6211621.1 tRNA preQ1(34) S-adenosylmethionine ribosyltransferase-isomerase QueA [Woeseia sp.]